MRTDQICVVFALLVMRGSRADNDFRPTPIPVTDWFHEGEARAGTLHETLKTDAPPSVAAVPAHYWEDALRHSVYLTLVRDKIDQLITKGEVISPDTKPSQYTSKDIDDHDLWEKIKTAPFDRIQQEEPALLTDVTIVAKGRLIEERDRFRFTEDERSKEKCTEDSCIEGVKAFWSVKRVRQRDVETSPGKYHYELTFSVSSQHSKKEKKPYENLVRTFTVIETNPNRELDMPREYINKDSKSRTHTTAIKRPPRSVWLHKNIGASRHAARIRESALDRIFASLFADDDDDYEGPKYSKITVPTYPQYSKNGYVGAPSDHQKRVTLNPYGPPMYKYARPISAPPRYNVAFRLPSAEYSRPLSDMKHGVPTRAVLPTPVASTPIKNLTQVEDSKSTTTKHLNIPPEIKTLQPTPPQYKPLKINYLEHVRPPIYNAPPSFYTAPESFFGMDKRPFKPLPQLKLKTKPKKQKPIDFRPSPQLLDMKEFSAPDPLQDTAFRPILWDITEATTANTTEKAQDTNEKIAESSSEVNKTQAVVSKGKKPPKKHEINKLTQTTAAPEIITASSNSNDEENSMEWAQIFSALGKTTPIENDDKTESPETTTFIPTASTTTTDAATTVTVKRRTTTTTKAPTETTPKPNRKRTRPPPKFPKPDRLKKHKRIVSGITTEKPKKKEVKDLTPDASSSAATKATKPTTTTTTSATTPTTTEPTSTTPTTTLTTSEETDGKEGYEGYGTTTQPKIRNRFRQSTLMLKGTSVKHDRWSASTSQPEKNKINAPLNKQSPRRKGSNFHGYVSSTTPMSDEKYEKIHEDKGTPILKYTSTNHTGLPLYEDEGDDEEEEKSDKNDQTWSSTSSAPAPNDMAKYLFPTAKTSASINEIDADSISTDYTTVTTVINKTKCKKKKTQTTKSYEETEELTTEQTETMEETVTTPRYLSTESTTENVMENTMNIFEQVLKSFTEDDSVQPLTERPQSVKEESTKYQPTALDDDVQKFLDSLERSGRDVSDGADAGDDDDADDDLEDYEDDEIKKYEDEGYDDEHIHKDSIFAR